MTKYHAVPTVVDNIRFDSKKEASRYSELKMLERCQVIKNLVLQPEFQVVVNGQKICKYRADFRYEDLDGRLITEDCKGVKTAAYSLKKKLVEALYKIRILET